METIVLRTSGNETLMKITRTHEAGRKTYIVAIIGDILNRGTGGEWCER
jgi:hypothetical protein